MLYNSYIYSFAVHLIGSKTNDEKIKYKGRMRAENLIIIRKRARCRRLRQKLHKLMPLHSQHWLQTGRTGITQENKL
jgi:hypothetical protein